jgi:hypothetical protein
LKGGALSQIEYWISVNDHPGYKVDLERFNQLRHRAGHASGQESWQGILPSSLPIRGWTKVSN